jgi:LysM repeat protein
MKIPKLPRLSSLAPQPKLRKPPTRLAAHARRLTPSAYEDYDEEPTTKLSTAFVVVLVLHLVAVGGIWAFHGIKAKRREADGTATLAATAAKPAPAPLVASTPAPTVASPVPTAPQAVAVAAPATRLAPAIPAPVQPPARSAVIPQAPEKTVTHNATPTQPTQTPPPAVVPKAVVVAQVVTPNPNSAKLAVGGVSGTTAPAGASADTAPKTYTVQKGDNPVAIAKKFGVGYEELLKVNGVDDPKKLQIGQVLKLPAKKSEAASH